MPSLRDLESGIERHKIGELQAAERIYRKFLSAVPNHADALHLLGVCRLQQGDGEASEALIRRAIERDPTNPEYFANLGATLQTLERLDEAVAIYRKALAFNPTLTEPLTNLAIIFHKTGRLEDAIACCRQAIAANPYLLKAYRKLADILFESYRYAEAIAPLEWVREAAPDDAANLNNLGFSYDKVGRPGDALACYQRAVALEPDRPEFLNNVGALLRRLGREQEAESYLAKASSFNAPAWMSDLQRARWLANLGRFDEAIAILLPEAEAGSEDVELLSHLGSLLCNVRRLREAHRWLVKALEIKPDHAEAMFHLGATFAGMDDPWQAECAWRKTLEMQPGHALAHIRICEIMDSQQRRDEANLWGRAALLLNDLAPWQKIYPFKTFRLTCDFEAINGLGDIWEVADLALSFGATNSSFLYLMVEADTLEKSRRLAALHRESARRIEERTLVNPLPPLTSVRRSGKLRVGLLSYDLRTHSVAKFVFPLLRHYDRAKLELYAYSLSRDERDPVQAEMRGLVDRFIYVTAETDRELAEAIRADGMEALVDMGGFTGGSRITALAYRAAPIQVEWLGYPFTTGFTEVDYMLVDRNVMPEESSLFYEKSLVIPHTWLCFEGYPDIPVDPVPPRDRNGCVTFGTLNNCYKITPTCIGAWAAIMRAVPGSRFLLVRPAGQSRILAENLMKEFGRHGIGGDRIFIIENVRDQHLECYNQIDIALDTFPVTGGTTTCDAMWMGVPTVSLRGPSMHQRVSHSLLMQVNLGELSVDNLADYVNKAVALADDRESLHLLRRVLRDVVRNSPIFRGDLFAEGFAQVLWDAARAHGLR